MGVGWCEEEVVTSGYTWADRGARADEFLHLMQQFWTEETISFEGSHFQIQPCHMDPKPLQNPHIPIIVGGHSKPALRRAAQYGDGWYGFQLTPEQTKRFIDKLTELRHQAGTQDKPFEIVITPGYVDDKVIHEFESLGIERLVLHLGSQRPEKIDQRLQQVQTLIN